jgi:DNA gyrase/topoisomerase IV subunit A
MLNNFDELYGDTKKNKLQLLEEMKENNIKYLDTIKDNMSKKYDEIINQIKESKQTQIPIVNKLKDKQNVLKQMLRSLKTLNQENITSTFQEIDSLQKEYSEEIETKCNSVSMISFKDWANYQEMSFKFDNYKENYNSKNEYRIGFCKWNLNIEKEDNNFSAVIILDKDCLQKANNGINFIMEVELMNQKRGKSIVLKEKCHFTKTNNKKIFTKLCSLNELERKGFADENGYVEIKVRAKFEDINDFISIQ